MLAQETYYTVKSDTNRLTKVLNVNIRYYTCTCIVSIREKVAGGKKYGASPLSHENVGSPIGTRLL